MTVTPDGPAAGKDEFGENSVVSRAEPLPPSVKSEHLCGERESETAGGGSVSWVSAVIYREYR